ncbi:peroxiredoxin family protein [uncultured Fibrella sp.]|uniref:peroxiredoxin family protein n=1 Tax=uncultured Fibrella sp. TaxID=1284596 RepID=UPI0035CA050C
MRYFSLLTFAGALVFTNSHPIAAQTATRQVVTTKTVVERVVSERVVINENTKLLDNQTGNLISYQTYQQLMKEDRAGYKLVPVINEYGATDAFIVRPTTTEERETRRFMDRDPALRPKAGDTMPEFVMKSTDDKEYRLSALKGKVVVLSFWMGVKPPYWNTRQATLFSDALQPYQTANGLVVLGAVRETKDDVANAEAAQTFPFIAIPNSDNFSRKFHVTRFPSVFVIDKTGKVAAYLEGQGMFEQLTKVLEQASR